MRSLACGVRRGPAREEAGVNSSRLFVVGVIFVVACGAWLVLGQTVTARTAASERTLGRDVDRMFGPRLVQAAPAWASSGGSDPPGSPYARRERHRRDDRPREPLPGPHLVLRLSRRLRRDLYLSRGRRRPGRFRMMLPDEANIDDLLVEVNGEALRVASTELSVAVGLTAATPAVVRVRYVTSGQDAWEYRPQTGEGGLANFRLTVRTNFEAIDYPPDRPQPDHAGRTPSRRPTRARGRVGVLADAPGPQPHDRPRDAVAGRTAARSRRASRSSRRSRCSSSSWSWS